MARIIVEFNQLENTENKVFDVWRKVGEEKRNFKNAIDKLDWEVKSQDRISYRSKQLINKLDKIEQSLDSYSKFLLRCYEKYDDVNNNKTKTGQIGVLGGFHNVAETIKDTPSKEKQRSDVEILADWIGYCKKTGIQTNFGPTKDVLDWISTLQDMYNGEYKDSCAAQAVGDLVSSATGAYSGIYESLQKYYANIGFLDENSKFSKGVGYADIIGKGAKTVGDIVSSYNDIYKIANDSKSDAADVVVAHLGMVDTLVDDIADFIPAEDAAAKYIKGTITALIHTGVDSVSQGIESIKKYSADGEWSFGDTANTGIEIATKGLYTMADKLSGGFLSKEFPNVTTDDISQSIENACEDIGSKAGNYIVQHPDLLDKYNKAGIIGKAAIMFSSAIIAA